MSRTIAAFGAALILVGVIAYFATGTASLTPLIPAFAGAPILLAGLVSTRPGWRSFGLYTATTLATLLALGTLRGTFGLVGGEVSTATVMNAALLVASLAFVALCVREIGRSRKGSYDAAG